MNDCLSGKIDRWEQRWHPFFQEWVVYSPHRNTRPWTGASETKSVTPRQYDPECYLCPGNTRIHNDRNPEYRGVFVFDNDHPVVGQDAPDVPPHPYYHREKAMGIARVICFDPRHHVTISDLSREQVKSVLSCWKMQTHEMSQHAFIRSALFFENKGEIVGTSCPHPHSQLYATNFICKNVARELDALEQYHRDAGTNLFDQIVESERKESVRIISENDCALAFVPFFARFSYEVWVFPKKRHSSLLTLCNDEIVALAEIYRDVSRKYDLLYNMTFPYVMSLYQAPMDGKDYSGYHLHFVFLPPLRRPNLRKFMGGAELGGGNFMCDTLPEDTARQLKELDPSTYYPIR